MAGRIRRKNPPRTSMEVTSSIIKTGMKKEKLFLKIAVKGFSPLLSRIKTVAISCIIATRHIGKIIANAVAGTRSIREPDVSTKRNKRPAANAKNTQLIIKVIVLIIKSCNRLFLNKCHDSSKRILIDGRVEAVFSVSICS